MTGFRGNRGLAANLTLALLLVAAQTSALAHAYEHDIGSSQNQACTTCVTASQLASACVDNSPTTEISAFNSPLNRQEFSRSASIDAIIARQRGPPKTL